MTIGVGVEGPSDRTFWNKVLHKYFKSTRFDVRVMKDRARLIRETPRLLEAFRDARYSAGFILVDRDDSPCPIAVVGEFEPGIQVEARKPVEERFLFICVAVRALEAWFMADEDAIRAVLEGARYSVPEDTGATNAGGQLVALWRQKYPSAAFNKIDFANRIAPKFSPRKARRHSPSFKHFWERLSNAAHQ